MYEGFKKSYQLHLECRLPKLMRISEYYNNGFYREKKAPIAKVVEVTRKVFAII